MEYSFTVRAAGPVEKKGGEKHEGLSVTYIYRKKGAGTVPKRNGGGTGTVHVEQVLFCTSQNPNALGKAQQRRPEKGDINVRHGGGRRVAVGRDQ